MEYAYIWNIYMYIFHLIIYLFNYIIIEYIYVYIYIPDIDLGPHIKIMWLQVLYQEETHIKLVMLFIFLPLSRGGIYYILSSQGPEN